MPNTEFDFTSILNMDTIQLTILKNYVYKTKRELIAKDPKLIPEFEKHVNDRIKVIQINAKPKYLAYWYDGQRYEIPYKFSTHLSLKIMLTAVYLVKEKGVLVDYLLGKTTDKYKGTQSYIACLTSQQRQKTK